MSRPKTLLEMSGAPQAPSALSQSAVLLIDCQIEYVEGPLALPGVKPALEEAKRWAGLILECSPMAIKATKETVLTGLKTADLKAAFDHKVPGIAKLMASADHKEGPKAFAEKRKPVWKNEQ